MSASALRERVVVVSALGVGTIMLVGAWRALRRRPAGPDIVLVGGNQADRSNSTRPHEPRPQRIVLVGGGHAHIQVIKALNGAARPSNVEVVLIDPQARASYSGMVPAAVSGLYTPALTEINLAPLAEWASIDYRNNRAVRLDPDNKTISLDDGTCVKYDVVSLDIGSVTRGLEDVPGAMEFTIPTRPISDLIKKIAQAEDEVADKNGPIEVVVVGAGAAGIELGFAIRARWGKLFPHLSVMVLDSGEEILPNESRECRDAVLSALEARNIQVRHGMVVERVLKDAVVLQDGGGRVPFTHCIWATGAASHPLAARLGTLARNHRGWVRVNPSLQSVSHAEVFAAGDCATIEGLPGHRGSPPKAGVYAVRSGPVLIQNLTRVLEGRAPVPYDPQDDFLKLIMCGDGTAIGFRFGIALEGKWVWELKDHIDRSFMELFYPENLPDLTPGCGFDTSQYDADTTPKDTPRATPAEAAKLLKRNDDQVNYKDAWRILRDMMTDTQYKLDVISHLPQ